MEEQVAIRCTECAHYLGRGAKCPAVETTRTVYQYGYWRQCLQYENRHASQALALQPKDYGTVQSKAWIVKSGLTGGRWSFVLAFPKPTDWRTAYREAGRHWSNFIIQPTDKAM